MKHLAKHLAAPAAFVLAFLLGGAPSAPVADVLVQGCGDAFADDEEVVIDCWDTGGSYGQEVDQDQRDLYNSKLCKTVREKDCWETAATLGTVGMALGYAGAVLSATGLFSGLGFALVGASLVFDSMAVGVGAACATQFD